MPEFILASTGNVFAASFGVTAAVLLFGGFILVRLRRDRHHFELMRMAMQQGVTAIPNSIPFWLASLRQGIMILVLGLMLVVVGGAVRMLAGAVPQPQTPSSQPAASSLTPLHDTPGRIERKGPQSRPAHEAKPPPNPAMERWRRAQQERSVGLIVIGCGVVLIPLGLVRIAFARVERRHTTVPAGSGEGSS